MKYFSIICHRGHAGSGRGTEIKFAICAEDLLTACGIARRMPGVKHSRFTIYGHEITEKEYIEYRAISAYERFPQHSKRRNYR